MKPTMDTRTTQGSVSVVEHLHFFVHTVVKFWASARYEEPVADCNEPTSREILQWTWTCENLRQIHRRTIEIAPMCVATQMREKSACLMSHYRRPSWHYIDACDEGNCRTISIDRIPLQRATVDISALRRALAMVINVMTTLQNTLRSDPVLPAS